MKQPANLDTTPKPYAGGQQGGNQKIKSALMIALIIHALAFIAAFLHWIFFWLTCPIAIPDGFTEACPRIPKTIYFWFLIISWVLFLAAIIVNIGVDSKKGTGQLTCYCAFGAVAFGIYYWIAYWIGDSAKSTRMSDIPYSGNLKFGKVLYWFYLFLGLAGGAVPAAMGGLAPGNKI